MTSPQAFVRTTAWSLTRYGIGSVMLVIFPLVLAAALELALATEAPDAAELATTATGAAAAMIALGVAAAALIVALAISSVVDRRRARRAGETVASFARDAKFVVKVLAVPVAVAASFCLSQVSILVLRDVPPWILSAVGGCGIAVGVLLARPLISQLWRAVTGALRAVWRHRAEILPTAGAAASAPGTTDTTDTTDYPDATDHPPASA